MPSLWDINDTIREIDEYLDIMTDSPEEADDRAFVQGLLDEVAEARDEKINGYAYVIRRLEHEATVAKEEAEHWRAKAQQRENHAKRLKTALVEHMQSVGQQKLSTDKFKLAVQQNGGKEPVEFDVDSLPDEYFNVPEPVPDVDRIRNALIQGVEVPGADLRGRGFHLRIR